MTHQHPLTDEICEELSSCITTLKSGDVDPYISPFDVKVDMQRAADWQLEQVIEWLRHNLDLEQRGIDYVVENLREAMRPQQQENN